MKKIQKGSVTIIITIIILLVVAFGTWVYFNKNKSQQKTIDSNQYRLQTLTTNSSNLDIHANPLLTSSTTPTLTGAYHGDYGVGVVILNGKQNLPKEGDFSSLPNTVIVAYSDHGGDVNPSSPSSTSGTFTYTVGKPLRAGVYTVGVFVYHNIYNEGYQGDSVQILTASTTLIVQS